MDPCADERVSDPRSGRSGRLVPAHARYGEPDDIGLPQERRFDEIAIATSAPPIIDADEFLPHPGRTCAALCTHLGIAFTDRMLSWPPGPRASDGVWAPHWYAAVRSSTGFAPWRPRETNLSEHDAAVAEACRPVYQELYARRVRV